jgi:hypothetical protein
MPGEQLAVAGDIAGHRLPRGVTTRFAYDRYNIKYIYTDATARLQAAFTVESR